MRQLYWKPCGKQHIARLEGACGTGRSRRHLYSLKIEIEEYRLPFGPRERDIERARQAERLIVRAIHHDIGNPLLDTAP